MTPSCMDALHWQRLIRSNFDFQKQRIINLKETEARDLLVEVPGFII